MKNISTLIKNNIHVSINKDIPVINLLHQLYNEICAINLDPSDKFRLQSRTDISMKVTVKCIYSNCKSGFLCKILIFAYIHRHRILQNHERSAILNTTCLII